VLDALRSAFDADGTSTSNAENANGQSSAARISRSIEKGDDLDFDLALNTVPLGSKGNKATYWIHPDHIVEAQVLLLQHMRLYVSKAKRIASSRGTPIRRHSSTTNLDPYLGNEDATSFVVLDHPEAFAFKQNASTIGATEELQGSIGIKAAGQVRCCASGEAAVVVCTEADAQAQLPVAVKTAKMERKRLQNFLDTSVKEDSLKHSGSSNGSAKDDASVVRQWLVEHQSTKPIAGALSKRTRFTGLHNNSTGGIWATLDKDICLKDSLYQDLADDDWTSAARAESAKKFPHAVLEIRREGNQATALIQTLDRSHLVRCPLLIHPSSTLTVEG
jgi:SPX domain protein involved in polyphosphate accumulation